MFKRMSFVIGSGLVIVAALTAPFEPAQADSSALTLKNHAYFMADDANGVQQVWRIMADTGEMAPITASPTDIVDFTVPHDALSVVYTSEGSLWLQQTSGADDLPEPRELIDLSTEDPARPIFSADDSLLAYADNGIWVLDMASGETAQYIENQTDYETMGVLSLRYFEARAFTADNGALIVNIGVWEGEITGIIDLATGELQELANFLHTDMLELSDGRLLLYGNGAIVGESDLQITTRADINNTREVLVNFADITEYFLYVDSAIELEDGTVRVVGTYFGGNNEGGTFYFDIDIATGTLLTDGIQQFEVLPSDNPETNISLGGFADGGNLIVQYLNVEFPGHNVLAGKLVVYDVAANEIHALEQPAIVAMFQ